MPAPELSSTFLYRLDLEGYAVVRGALEPELVRDLEVSLRRLEGASAEELPEACPSSWTPVVQERRLLNVAECGAPFERLIDHTAILSRIERLVPAPQRLTEAYSISRATGVGIPLHRIESAAYHDTLGGPRCDHLTVVICLSDCGPEDGPMVIFAGSHKLSAPFPFARIHPHWEDSGRDPAFAEAFRREQGELLDVPWEDIPGYREIHTRRGDLVFFVQSLWHGARELRSSRVRRTLYYSYSPYHFPNWHGIAYSDELLGRVGPRQRELLSGPFMGSRYTGIHSDGIPDCPQFPVMPDSEEAPYELEPAPPPAADAEGEGAARRVRAGLLEAARRCSDDPSAVRDLRGRCRLRLSGAQRGDWLLELGAGGLEVREEAPGEVDTLLEAEASDVAALLDGRADPVELFWGGRLRARGDVSLAMRLASVLFP